MFVCGELKKGGAQVLQVAPAIGSEPSLQPSQTHPDNLLKRLLIDVHACHHLLHISKDHIEVLVISLEEWSEEWSDALLDGSPKGRCVATGHFPLERT